MPLTDLSRAELESYRPEVLEPDDFDDFWSTTLAQAGPVEDPVLVRADTPLTGVDVWDMTFSGWAGHPIRAWLVAPVGVQGRLPGVVEYVGYGGGRGLPEEHLRWASTGRVHLVMDTRGQGSAWGGGGDTPDPAPAGGPSAPGFMTRGIESPETYYYRRVFVDAVRAVDALRSVPFVDPEDISVTGTSQGGGISLAVAGLRSDVAAVMPDVPYLCHFRRAVEVAAAPPFTEITRYLGVHRDVEETVFRTLSYFDGVSFARRAHAPALFSVGLMDDVVPPSTVYAAAHAYGGRAELTVYPYNGHDGGGLHQWRRQVAWSDALRRARA